MERRQKWIYKKFVCNCLAEKRWVTKEGKRGIEKIPFETLHEGKTYESLRQRKYKTKIDLSHFWNKWIHHWRFNLVLLAASWRRALIRYEIQKTAVSIRPIRSLFSNESERGFLDESCIAIFCNGKIKDNKSHFGQWALVILSN